MRYRTSIAERRLYGGLIRMHLLHHAAEAPFYGQEMIDELARHGYRLSAGTLYPLLHGLESAGYLRSRVRTLDGRQRRVYQATPHGRRTLKIARDRVRELFGEMFEHD